MEIVIDFDGTCVTHDFPRIGMDIGATPVLRKLVKNGHKLILFTMRSNVENVGSPEFEGLFTGNYLDDAIKWFKHRGVELHGVQTNPTQKEWTTSPKAYGQLYIDDSALGCPLIKDPQISNRPFVDWEKVELILIKQGIL